MYNLGVFHAQGKGGMKTNLNIARQLFSAAAKKGHVQASEAIELENSYQKHPRLQENLTESSKNLLEVKTLSSGVQNLTIMNLMNHNFLSDFNDKILESDQFLNSIDENSSKNPTDMFLNMLGINGQNTVSFISVVDAGS